jgi:putative transposase
LLALKGRGMNAPKLAIGDGAMGFWAALEEVFPRTRQQRCWMHKMMNVLNCLPKLSQPKAKAALHDIWQAENKADAGKAFDLFLKIYEPKYPKATLCLQKDRGERMSFPSQQGTGINFTFNCSNLTTNINLPIGFIVFRT